MKKEITTTNTRNYNYTIEKPKAFILDYRIYRPVWDNVWDNPTRKELAAIPLVTKHLFTYDSKFGFVSP